MKKNIIFSLLLATILSTTVLAQIDNKNKKVVDVIPASASTTNPRALPAIDRTLYDENGIALVQLNLPKGVTASDISTTTVQDTEISKEEKKLSNTSSLDAKDVKQGELAACFDYYKFGSVNVSMITDRDTYESGGLPIIIEGDITNNNKYPMVGLDIKARLVKNIPSPEPMRAEIITLDDFDVAKNITIKAGGVYIIPTYALSLPLNTPAGEYQILFYAVEQERFNMAGLSFTNDIIASKVDFTITGKNPEHIYLDQTKITVGGQPHDVMAFMTQHVKDISIPVNIPLNNPGNVDQKMTVTYDLYLWDALTLSNKINTKTETVLVPAKSSKDLTYTLDKGVLPVYYLRITAEPESQTKDKSVFKEKTISNIRFVVQGLSKPRINFTGIDKFPLKKGDESTLFTCFHNTNSGVNENNTKIETVLYDQDNVEISRLVYNGKTIPDISGLIKKFIPKKDIFNFTVVTKMFDSTGKELDSIEKRYNCKDIDATTCPQKKSMYYYLSILGGVLALIAVIVLMMSIYKRNKNLKQ